MGNVPFKLNKRQKEILKALLNKYEKSKTYRGENMVNQSFQVKPKDFFKEYDSDFADLDEQGRIVAQLRHSGIGLGPFGKGPLFRPGELDLLHAGDEGIAQAGFLRRVFHVPAVDPCLRKCGNGGKTDGDEHDDEGRDHESRGEPKDLSDIEERRQRGQACIQNDAHQHRAEGVDGHGAAF